MPALVLFGRRWSIGTDDFVLPASLDLLIRFSWVIATFVFYWVDVHGLECVAGKYVKLYFCGHFVLMPLISFIDVRLVKASSRGGVMEVDARKHVPVILYLRILGEFMSLTWNFSGIIWFWTDVSACYEVLGSDQHRRLRCYVVFNMMSALFFGAFWICAFDPLGRDHLRKISIDEDAMNNNISSELPDTRRARYWERRLRVCCWGFPYLPFFKNKDTLEGFREVGKILAHFVQDYDLVMTDFFVGLVALPKWKLSLEDYDSCSREYVESPNPRCRSTYFYTIHTDEETERVYFEMSDPIDCHDVSLMKHYHKYIGIIYGWQGFVMSHGGFPFRAHRRIWKHMLWCANHRPRPDGAQIDGDNSWHRNTASLKEMIRMSHLKDVDLIYATFHNDYYQNPFCLTVDHRYKSFVITVRGCASCMDFFTTLTAWPVPTGIPGLPDTFRVHHGFLMSARNAYGKVHKQLEKIRAFYPDYKLVLTGYSMGGGIATVLGMILWSEYPDLSVYAFSPPGGILNSEASAWASSFTTTTVHFTDLIPRLSLYSLDKYISQMITAIHECRTPKYRVILGALLTGYFPIGIGHQKIKFKSPDKNTSHGDDGIRIEGPIPDLTYSSPKVRMPIPIMVLPGRIIGVHIASSKHHRIFSSENLGAYLRIWTFLPVWEQFSGHTPNHLRTALYRFMKFRQNPDFDPVHDTTTTAESESGESDPELFDNIV